MRGMIAPIALALLAPSSVAVASEDSDGDGLSDFLETHKYLTDPSKADSDGDGVPDGDWLERREFAYTVRSVVQVMRPVTPEFLDDAYQDARVLDETETYVELEVIHYPLVSLKDVAHRGADPEDLARWLEPGPTSNASPALGRSIHEAMERGGGKVPDLTSSAGVAKAAQWLLEHAKHNDRFTTFITAVDSDGRFYIPEELEAYADSKSRKEGIAPEKAWPREIEAAGMFEHGQRGSCTSSAIYLSGCLRALGVPTRTVLCIPIIDAGDESEWKLLESGIQHNGVRPTIARALEPSRRGWSSHTFNEVYVEGRWHRLNYSDIDAGILNEGFFGLMTHVATFHDWADARMWETVGRRSTFSNDQKQADVFGHHNPYSTIALRDSFGPHCKVENPPAQVPSMEIEALYWTDSADLPQDILSSNQSRGRRGLIAELTAPSMDSVMRQLRAAEGDVTFEGQGAPSQRGAFHPGCVWLYGDRAYLYIQLSENAWNGLVKDAKYRVKAKAKSDAPSWILDATMTR